MTTIIIVVVVALVFFVTVCVVTFMVWKRETEMRTDSIRSIESNLEKLGDKLASGVERHESDAPGSGAAKRMHEADSHRKMRRGREGDPFHWIRDDSTDNEPRQAEIYQQECDDGRGDQADEPNPDPMEKASQLMKELEAIRVELPKMKTSTDSEGSEEAAATEIEIDAEQEPDGSAEQEQLPQEQEEEIMEINLDFVDDMDAAAAEDEAEEYEDGEDEREQEAFAFDAFDEMMEALPEMPVAADSGEDELALEDTAGAIGRSGKRYTAEELEELIKE